MHLEFKCRMLVTRCLSQVPVMFLLKLITWLTVIWKRKFRKKQTLKSKQLAKPIKNVRQEIVNTIAMLRLNHSLSILLLETGAFDKNTRKAWKSKYTKASHSNHKLTRWHFPSIIEKLLHVIKTKIFSTLWFKIVYWEEKQGNAEAGYDSTYCKAQKGPQTTVDHLYSLLMKMCQELRMVNSILTSSPKNERGGGGQGERFHYFNIKGMKKKCKNQIKSKGCSDRQCPNSTYMKCL